LQYLYLAEHQARKLRPDTVLVGFYFGNDILDARRFAHQLPYWHGWRDATAQYDGEAEFRRAADAEPKKKFAAIRDWLSRHSVLYSIVRVTLLPRLALGEGDRLARGTPPDRQMLWSDPSMPTVRTIFTPQLRLSVLDPQLPGVQEGLRITKRAFASIRTRAEAHGMHLLVVLIPTKERAYCRYLKDMGSEMPATLIRLCEAEQLVKEELARFLDLAKIRYVDVTPALEEQIYSHVQIYPPDADAHPQALGYGVIARAIFRRLDKGQEAR
jgi:hypothetical protein